MQMNKTNVEHILERINPSFSLKGIKEDYKDGVYSMAEIVLAIIGYMEGEQD